MSPYFWLLVIVVIFAILYMEKSYRLKKMTKLFSKMEHKFFKNQAHKERFLAEMTRTDAATQVALDPMTGLPDSQVFTDRLSQAVQQSKRHKMSFGVMLLSINDFSKIKEESGSEIADKIVIETARRLKNIVRQVDTVCRYQDTRFVFLLPLLSKPETAAFVAQRAQDAIMQSYNIDGKDMVITASLGIAIYPADGDDATLLLQHAEAAMQQAEVGKKNSYQFFQKELQVLGQREISLTNCLSSPNVADYLLVQYQPHIDVDTNTIVCIQAILHLQHPDYGLIAFPDFYKLAVNAGRISEVGEWFLSHSIKQFKKWESDNFTPPLVSLSVSMKQIENPKFLSELTRILKETDFDPKKIIFDISENILTENSAAVDVGFSVLTKLGTKISIGIFALGHFALSKLGVIPIDYLKIDGKLIRDVLQHHENENILGMIISLANESDIVVVADGVEHKKQKILLKQLGCRIMQGKLFGAPESASTVVQGYHS